MHEVTTVLEVVSNIPYSFNSDKIESYGEESNGLVIKRVVIKWRRNNITKSRSFLQHVLVVRSLMLYIKI